MPILNRTARLLLLPMILPGLLTASGCYRNEVVEHVFSIPKLVSEECSGLVLQALATQDGILSAQPDLVNQKLMVSFNTRLIALRNIEYAIAEAGFDIDESQGRDAAKARLPEGCR